MYMYRGGGFELRGHVELKRGVVTRLYTKHIYVDGDNVYINAYAAKEGTNLERNYGKDACNLERE